MTPWHRYDFVRAEGCEGSGQVYNGWRNLSDLRIVLFKNLDIVRRIIECRI